MGFWNTLFRSDSSSSGTTVKVRESRVDNAHIRANKLDHVDDGRHTHLSYDLDTASGEYREYTGGENSDDRSYNK